MDYYLDLSIIAHIILISSCLKFTSIIFNNKIKFIKYILFILITSLILIIPILDFSFDLLVTFFIFFIATLLVFKKKAVKYYFVFIFVYLSIVLFLTGISNKSNLKGFVLIISDFYALIYLMFIPILLLILIYSVFAINSFRVLKKYILDINIYCQNNKYQFQGYFDTGNTLIFKGMPVIFIESKNFKELDLNNEKNLNINIATINGVSKSNNLIKGKVEFVKREKIYDIWICLNSKIENFHGCQCLLNAYLN